MVRIKFFVIFLFSLLLSACGGGGGSGGDSDAQSDPGLAVNAVNLDPLNSPKVFSSEVPTGITITLANTVTPGNVSAELIDTLIAEESDPETEIIATIIGVDPDGQFYLVEFTYITAGVITAQYTFRVEADIPISDIEKPPTPAPTPITKTRE